MINAIYGLVLVLSLPWLGYRAVFLNKSRRGWRQKLWGQVPVSQANRPTIWMHAVSVGEVQLLAPLIARLSSERPEVQFAVSTSTESGYSLAQQKFAEHSVFFFPVDFTWAVRNVLQRVKPELILLAELELWPNFLAAARRERVPVFVINGRMSDRSFRRYRWISGLTRWMLGSLHTILVQNKEYADRFVALGADPARVEVTGNVKFDGAFNPKHAEFAAVLKSQFQILEDEAVFVAGSTQPVEDELVVKTYITLSEKFPALRLIIVPRHMQNVSSLIDLLGRSGLQFVRRSEPGETIPRTGQPRPVIVVDVVGELAAWWQLADIAYVGGSMGSRGGQNMIEPAAAKAAVSFGPRTENFRDVVSMLLTEQAATVVRDQIELLEFIERCLNNSEWRCAMGQAAYRIVAEQQGATQRTCDLVTQQLDSVPKFSARHQRAA